MELPEYEIRQLEDIGFRVLLEHAQVPLRDRVNRLIDDLLDLGRKDAASTLYDDMAIVRHVYSGGDAGAELVQDLRRLAEAAARMYDTAARHAT